MPIHLAVLATAIVHISNNSLKFILIRNFIDKQVLISFGITAVIGAFLGAMIQKYIGINFAFFKVRHSFLSSALFYFTANQSVSILSTQRLRTKSRYYL